jgi:hypothetical protein
MINKNQLIERVQRYLSNGLVSDDFAPSKNEISLYINDAIAAVVTKTAKGNYGLDAVLSVPEGVLSRFSFTSFTKDSGTGEWYVTLPDAPLSLPLGYSISDVYFTGTKGRGIPCYAVNQKAESYFRNLPRPTAAYYYIEGGKMYLCDINLLATDLTLKVVMVSPSSTNDDSTINLSPDLVQEVFNIVVAQMTQRFATMKVDNNNDGNTQP